MAIKSKWTMHIQSLRLGMRVGLHSHERGIQPMQLSLKVSGLADTHPSSIANCVDYDPLMKWLTHELPSMPHTELLETRINEIAQFIFSTDKRILGLWVGLYKEGAFPNVSLIGVEKEMTRRQFDEYQRINNAVLPMPALNKPAASEKAPVSKRLRKKAAA